MGESGQRERKDVCGQRYELDRSEAARRTTDEYQQALGQLPLGDMPALKKVLSRHLADTFLFAPVEPTTAAWAAVADEVIRQMEWARNIGIKECEELEGYSWAPYTAPLALAPPGWKP